MKKQHNNAFIVTTDVTGIGPRGDGIARLERGGSAYISRALPGDTVRARIMRDDEGINRGDILEILTPSTHRADAPCRHYDRCGGCTLQHATHDFYAHFKRDLIPQSLSKAGLKTTVRDTVFVPSGTRRRATFAAFLQKDKIITGYYARRSKNIADIDACMVCTPELLAARDKIAPGLRKVLKDSRPADLFLQLVGDALDVCITGPVGHNGKVDPPTRVAMIDWAKENHITRLSWRAKPFDRPDIIVQYKPVTASFGAFNVALPASAFLQPSLAGEEALWAAVQSALPDKIKRIADLFCGSGTFAGRLAAHAPVDAYDSVEEAVAPLRKAMGGTQNQAFTRDLFRQPLKREELNRYDCIVFDPPRAGAREQAEHLAASKVGTVIGVSCNPATFARDAAILCRGGYRLDWVQPVDQFNWSHHIELVAKFSHK